MASDARIAPPGLGDPAALIATWFGVGFVKWAPGTAASLVTLPVAWVLRSYTGMPGLALAALALLVIGMWAAGVYQRRTGTRDSPVIVIDEVVGQCTALLLVPADLALYAIGFVLFRSFDVVKPWPIGPIDRHVRGGLGVMLDDVVAGGVSAIVLWHIWIWL